MPRTTPFTLAIETAAGGIGAALLHGGTLIAAVDAVIPRSASSELVPFVQKVLKAGHVTVSDLEGISVSVGPGSFTGLRIGLAFAKALALALRTPLVGVPTFEAIAANAGMTERAICVAFDAKQEQLYAAWYAWERGRLRTVAGAQLMTCDHVMKRLRRATVLLGDAVDRYPQLGRRRTVAVAPRELWWPRAATIGRLGALRLSRGHTDDPKTLLPLYLYARDCTIKSPQSPAAEIPPRRRGRR